MSTRHTMYAQIFVLSIVLAGMFVVVNRAEAPAISPVQVPNSASTTVETLVATTTPLVATSTTTTTTKSMPATTTVPKAKKATIKATESAPPTAPASPNDILRIDNPYSTPPLTFESINIAVRAALVNIYCSTPSAGTLKPITGSGVMVDPRGVVLTNAHVAQYVLIAQSGTSDLTCTVRTGAPAVRKWIPVVMYIPTVWVDLHATDITQTRAVGTGEHDYALLYMTATVDGSPLPASFPFVSPDVREAIGFVDDAVLVASYPVEFAGGTVIQNNLYPVTSLTNIRQLLTFTVGSADAVSLGGVISAQSGSSGGGVINQWNRLIGLITTTSEGSTTGVRDLHAITTAYINRDMTKLTGSGLLATLASDPRAASTAFVPTATQLGQKLIDVILGR